MKSSVRSILDVATLCRVLAVLDIAAFMSPGGVHREARSTSPAASKRKGRRKRGEGEGRTRGEERTKVRKGCTREEGGAEVDDEEVEVGEGGKKVFLPVWKGVKPVWPERKVRG